MTETGFSEQLGKVQERYRFLAKLGSGGMADVFLGVQHGAEDFRRLVVIKRIHSMWLKKDNALTMFIDEARTVASLNHPHIVKIYDLSRMGKDICIAMEYVDGENLDYIRRALKKRNSPIPLPVICKLMVEACEALYYAHSAKTTEGNDLNLVHRDIGPHNLMIDSNGYLKVIDFGIAKSTAQTELTSPGMIKGKYSYLAPDLFKYVDIDGRVDLYALGLVFYELLTLRRPYVFKQDVAVAEVLHRITTESLPPVSSVVPELPKDLDAIINKAIHKEREQRYQSGADFASEIREFADNFGGVASTTDVEKWYRDHFQERIGRRREFERRAMAKAASPPKLPANEDDENQIVTNETANISDIVQLQGQQGVSGSHVVPSSTMVQTRSINPYVMMLFVFALLTGALILFHQLFWKAEPASKEETVPQKLADNLYISSDPQGAEIFIDEMNVGNTGSSGRNLRVEPGLTHKVVLRLAGYEDYALEVPGETVGQRRINAKLIALKPKEEPAVASAETKSDEDADDEPSEERSKLNLKTKDREVKVASRLAKRKKLKRRRKAKSNAAVASNVNSSSAIELKDEKFTKKKSDKEKSQNKIAAKANVKNASEKKNPAANLNSEAPPQTQIPTPETKVAMIQPSPPAKPTYQSLEVVKQRCISCGQPAYPRMARVAKKEGRVLVKITIDRKGKVAHYKFMKDDPLFHDVVVAAIRKWKFRPFMINGRAVETFTVYKFNFRL